MLKVSYEVAPAPVEKLCATEWLLTNGLGGFAMGTAAGVPTRRYHGLLVASLRPPVNRVMTLSAMSEAIVAHAGTPLEDRTELSAFRFSPDMIHPRGDQLITRFWKDHAGVHWHFQAAHVAVTKSVMLVRNQATAVIRYVIDNPRGVRGRLELRPLTAMRDFHALQLHDLARGKFRVEVAGGAPGSVAGGGGESPAVQVHAQGTGTLLIRSTGKVNARFVHDEQWWNNFLYSVEQSRGYDALEDLFTPGMFIADLPPAGAPCVIELQASLGQQPVADSQKIEPDQAQRLTRMMDATRITLGPAFSRVGPQGSSPLLSRVGALVAAADDFVVHRVRPGAMPGAPADRESIIAGYPWFADWGRDSMIALPGLLLTTGRLSEAREVLKTFAGACKDGLIPNVFDDYTGAAHYNTVDASLWFLQAACKYFKASGDDETFTRELLPACREIVERYQHGTVFGIGMDPVDGLINAGDASTQLTWMDAKRDGVVFTPRHGKPVEISALWQSGLVELGIACDQLAPPFARSCKALAERAAASIREKFWNADRNCLFDVLTPLGPDASIRPNMLFAVSLPHCPLSQEQQRGVVKVATEKLYTPHGVRTLAPDEPGYRGRFRGRMFDRDAAYHNGTAWPWLLGPLAEAVIRSERFSPGSLLAAQGLLDPIVRSMEDGCLGQLAEVYDGDDTQAEPQHPGACPAQAWSVAETLRVYTLIARVQAGSSEE